MFCCQRCLDSGCCMRAARCVVVLTGDDACVVQVPTRAQRGSGQCLHDVEPVVTGPLHRSQR